MSHLHPYFTQMSQLWRRDVTLSERLGNDSPVDFAPVPPATVAPQGTNTSWVPEAPVVTPEEPIFLMTSTAQTISGFFVWTALLITCHQVRRAWRLEFARILHIIRLKPIPVTIIMLHINKWNEQWYCHFKTNLCHWCNNNNNKASTHSERAINFEVWKIFRHWN